VNQPAAFFVGTDNNAVNRAERNTFARKCRILILRLFMSGDFLSAQRIITAFFHAELKKTAFFLIPTPEK
jgi:hypothetical protein